MVETDIITSITVMLRYLW